MNIIVLNYEYPPIGGGAAPVAKLAAECLATKGHGVTVVTMGYSGLQNFEEENGIKIYRLPCWRTKPAVCYPWEQLTYIISAMKFLKKMLKKERYDICHTHFIIPTGVISLWMKYYYDIPYVIMSHGSDVPGYNQNRFKLMHKILRLPWRKICKEASCITAPSMYLRNLIKQGEASIDCKILPNSIDLNAYRCEPKKNIILTMSRLQEHKGIQRLIYAFSRLSNEGWELHIAGDGPYRSELEVLVKKLEISKKVIFHGWLENKSKAHISLLANAKIFVSASEFESFGVSVAEAVASNCYVLLSDIEAHRYFEQFGVHFFPTHDIDKLTTMLQEALADSEEVNIINKDALSLDSMANNLEKILSLYSNRYI